MEIDNTIKRILYIDELGKQTPHLEHMPQTIDLIFYYSAVISFMIESKSVSQPIIDQLLQLRPHLIALSILGGRHKDELKTIADNPLTRSVSVKVG